MLLFFGRVFSTTLISPQPRGISLLAPQAFPEGSNVYSFHWNYEYSCYKSRLILHGLGNFGMCLSRGVARDSLTLGFSLGCEYSLLQLWQLPFLDKILVPVLPVQGRLLTNYIYLLLWFFFFLMSVLGLIISKLASLSYTTL